MAKRMLIDATQPEETRVAVIDGNRLDELDFEIASRKQLKGNIYLAKVTRVEPSLQAAFVDYGGNRHGFLAFAEIHPDYYKIPVADREKLLALEAEIEREEAEREEAEEAAAYAAAQNTPPAPTDLSDAPLPLSTELPLVDPALSQPQQQDLSPAISAEGTPLSVTDLQSSALSPIMPVVAELPSEEAGSSLISQPAPASAPATIAAQITQAELASAPIEASEIDDQPVLSGELLEPNGESALDNESGEGEASAIPSATPTAEESDDDAERRRFSRRRAAILRQYKIQEVIKKNQILLIQVVKEERGNKGAALTTYLSLAGRYCVLMPNTNRGGGVSRKISSIEERRRMKMLLSELSLPEGMSIILRTAGLERSKADIKRDLEYLLRLWDSIREKTLGSTAPSLIHEEANLIRRAIRDLYSRDVAEIQVEGDTGYHTAKEFMRMMVPSAARRVHHYRDPAVPLFIRHRVESQIEALYSTTVGLRSGGYIVINQTEALVAIDVNSGRSTRERNIEETALRTNLEAADEVARQLRLRDLAGLIVIDFIDMEDQRHNGQVERRMREAMKNDRARIQIGRISMFGLLELSRQRLRPSLIETNFSPCPTCGGLGHVRSIESAALHILRSIEEEGLQQKASELAVRVAEEAALYLLNHKRAAIGDVERRYGIKVFINSDSELKISEHKIERLKARQPGEFQFPEPPPAIIEEDPYIEEAEPVDDWGTPDSSESGEGSADEDGTATNGSSSADENDPERRNRRRRRGGRGRNRGGDRPVAFPDVSQPGAPQPEIPLIATALADGEELQPANLPAPDESGYIAMTAHGTAEGTPEGGENAEGQRRRRGRRGGRGRYRSDGRGDRPTGADGESVPPDTTSAEGQIQGDVQTEARPPREPREQREPRAPREPRQGGRPPRGPRQPYNRDQSERTDSGSGRSYSATPPGGSPAPSDGGIKIVTAIRGRDDVPPPVAPAAAPSSTSATTSQSPSPEKPKTGWWKRLIGN